MRQAVVCCSPVDPAAVLAGLRGRHASWLGPARALRAFCAVLLLTTTAAAATTGNADPATFVQQLGNDAIKELADPAIAQSEREVRFRRLLQDRFDMAAISKFVLGRYWRSADERQRAEFQQLFVDFVVRSYSTRFGEYLGNGIKVTGASAEDGGTVLVHSSVDMPSSSSSRDVRVDWRLRGVDDNLAIVDIVAEGVSMSMTQRSQFASMVQDHGGLTGAIDALRTQTAVRQ